jgi:VanZ family protein
MTGTSATAVAAMRRWRTLLVLLIVVVSYLALTPAPPKDLTLGWDKFNHMAAFAALTIAAYGGVRVSLGRLLLLSASLLAFGGLIEILQLFVPGRSCEWGDLFADSIGIAFGMLVAAAVFHVLRRSSRKGP